MRPKRRPLLVFLALAAAAGLGSAAAGAAPAAAAAKGGGAPPPDLPEMRTPDLDLRAMLLLIAERRVYEPVTVLQALKGGTEVRAELASALARTPGAEARSVLEGLLIDDQAEVRRAAAFSLGVRGEAAAAAALRRAMHDPDRETGALAVEALGRLATPLVEVAGELLSLPEEERWARLLPYLFRFRDEARLPLAEHGLGLADAELHRWAAYAVARDPLPGEAPLLRRLAGDPDSQVRAWAARGLGRVGGVADLAVLAPLLGDPAAGPVVEALRAGAALAAAGDRGRSAKPAAAPPGTLDAPGGWRRRLLALLADRRAGVRITAIEAAAAWLPDPELGAALAARAAGPAVAAAAPGQARPAPPGAPAGTSPAPPAPASPAPEAVASPAAAVEQGMALVSLAHGRDPRASALAAAAGRAAEPRLRALAAEAAALLGDGALARRLAADPSALVREAALTARLWSAPPPAKAPGAGAAGKAGGAAGGPARRGAGESSAARVAVAALADPDEGVRTTACGWLADHPAARAAVLAGALAAALRDESIESPLGAIKALAARGAAEPSERGAAVELLERLGAQPSYALRREAAAALVRLGRPAPALGPVRGLDAGGAGEDLASYREIVERTRRARTVEVRTNRGSFRVRLDCPRAPRTCLSFLALAGQHFYDGLLFHRVVPDFVIQGGDPRGDGFGGPGYVLGDELNRLRFRRGVVGMALAGPDTGGSQFFITLAPQPHLDGAYTAFGEVTAGAEVVDAIQAGDRIEAIVEVP